MRHAHRRLRLVHVLPAGAASAEQVDAEILLGYLQLVLLVSLREHHHRRGARVDAPLRLRLGDALDAVSAALEAEEPVGPLALHREDDLLVAVERGLVCGHHADTPALRLAVARIHPEEIAREQGGLLSPRAGAYLEAGVARLQRVGRQKPGEHIALGIRYARRKARDLPLGLGGQLRVEGGIRQHRLRAVDVVQKLEVALRRRLELLERGVLAHRLAVALRVRNN